MCVLDGPCIHRDNRKIEHRPKKKPKLQTNLICIFEKKRTENRRYTGISRMHTKIKGKKDLQKMWYLVTEK